MCEYCEDFYVHGEGPDFVDGEFTDRFHLAENEQLKKALKKYL